MKSSTNYSNRGVLVTWAKRYLVSVVELRQDEHQSTAVFECLHRINVHADWVECIKETPYWSRSGASLRENITYKNNLGWIYRSLMELSKRRASSVDADIDAAFMIYDSEDCLFEEPK